MENFIYTLGQTIGLHGMITLGHFIPLGFAIFFVLHSLRGANWRGATLWLLATAASAMFIWYTAALQPIVMDGKQVGVGIGLSWTYPAVIASLIMFARGSVAKLGLVFSGAFFSLWAVDIVCALKVGIPLIYVGGGGPLDALVVGPIAAVAAAWTVKLDLAASDWLDRKLGGRSN